MDGYFVIINYERIKIEELLTQWTPHHRVVWVGDACMAPYGLLAPSWNSGRTGSFLDTRYSKTLSSFRLAQPRTTKILEPPNHSKLLVKLNMYPLTLQGLKDGIKNSEGSPNRFCHNIPYRYKRDDTIIFICCRYESRWQHRHHIYLL